MLRWDGFKVFYLLERKESLYCYSHARSIDKGYLAVGAWLLLTKLR